MLAVFFSKHFFAPTLDPKLSDIYPAVRAELHATLGGAQLVETNADAVQNAELLCHGQPLSFDRFLAVLGPAQAQLAGSDDGLLHEAALKISRCALRADQLAGVSNGWVWVETRLFLSAFRGLNVGGRLRECRVVL